eukprot:3830157-Rhodomonas_salina.1
MVEKEAEGGYGMKLWHWQGFMLGFLLHPAMILLLFFIAALMSLDMLRIFRVLQIQSTTDSAINKCVFGAAWVQANV